MNGWLIALGLLAAYVTFVVWLVTSGRLKKWNLSLMLGIVLMVRTQRGKGLIDALSRPKRLWNAFGDFGTVLALTGMALMTAVMLLSMWVSLQKDSGVEPLGAAEILVIPGVNPFVPLWYGILALILTLVVHEGGHGVLARANGMRLKSLGLLFAVVPVGAFVEPDEDDLRQSSRRRRLRVFSAGPLLNLTFAALFLVLFCAGVAAAGVPTGAGVVAVARDGPAEDAGIEYGDVIVRVGRHPVTDGDSFRAAMRAQHPGELVDVELDDGTVHRPTLGRLWDALDRDAQERILTDDAYGIRYCREAHDIEAQSGDACAERLQASARLGIAQYDGAAIRGTLSRPFGGDCSGVGFPRSLLCEMTGFLQLASLPVGEVRGSPVLGSYLPTFHDPPWGGALYWPLVTLAFWMFWINLMVGLTNILPMLPLDGGHIFRDAVGGLVHRIAPGADEERKARVVGRIATVTSFTILGAFLVMILGPRFV